jgi:hypothetical protein
MLMQDNCQPIRENKVNREKELAKKERARPLPFFYAARYFLPC